MFLDRTNLLKTVDRRGTERCHVLSRSSKFLVAVLFERQPVLVERGPRSYEKQLKMAKIGLDRQDRVIQAYWNIRILRHSLSQPVFFMFSHRFSSVFGLFTIVQGSVETRSMVCQSRSRPFLYFSHQNLFTDGQFGRSLVQHHQKIPLQYNFCTYKWKDTVANQFCNMLTHCAAVQHMGHAWKT